MLNSIAPSTLTAVLLWLGVIIGVAASSVLAKKLAGRRIYRGAGPKHGGATHVLRLLVYIFRNTAAFSVGAAVPFAILVVICTNPAHFFLTSEPQLLDGAGRAVSDVHGSMWFALDQAFKGGLNDFSEVFRVDVALIKMAEGAVGLKFVVFGYRLLLNAIAFYALWRASLFLLDLSLIWVPLPKDDQGHVRRINFTKTSRGYVDESDPSTRSTDQNWS